MIFENAPHTDGVMELEQVDIDLIEADLLQIKEAFVPTIDEQTLTLHSLVSRYNALNKGNEINGDTAQVILSQIEVGE